MSNGVILYQACANEVPEPSAESLPSNKIYLKQSFRLSHEKRQREESAVSGTEASVPSGSRLSFTSHIVSCVPVSHLRALWSKWHLVSKLRHAKVTDDCDYVPLRTMFRIRILEPKGASELPGSYFSPTGQSLSHPRWQLASV